MTTGWWLQRRSNKVFCAPKLSKGNFSALEDIRSGHGFVIIPDKEGWPMKKGIDVVSLKELIDRIEKF